MNIIFTCRLHTDTHSLAGTHGDPSGGFSSWCANKLSFSSLGLLSSSSPHHSQVIAGGKHHHNELRSRTEGDRKGPKWRWREETEEATNTLVFPLLSATYTKMSFWHDTKEPWYVPPFSSFSCIFLPSIHFSLFLSFIFPLSFLLKKRYFSTNNLISGGHLKCN